MLHAGSHEDLARKVWIPQMMGLHGCMWWFCDLGFPQGVSIRSENSPQKEKLQKSGSCGHMGLKPKPLTENC